jgi:hypothetical protein
MGTFHFAVDVSSLLPYSDEVENTDTGVSGSCLVKPPMVKCFEHGRPTTGWWALNIFYIIAFLTTIALLGYLVNNAINDPPVSPASVQSSGLSNSGVTVSASSSSNASPVGDCASFAVIAINEAGSTKDSFPLLTKARNFYPLSKFATSVINQITDPPTDPNQIPAWITSVLTPKLNEIESLAQGYVKKAIRVIHGPTRSLMVKSFLTAQFQYYDVNNVLQTVKFFGGKNVNQRYPSNVQFTFSNAGTDAIDNYDKLVRFADVDTGQDATIITGNLAQLGLVAGDATTKILFINEPADTISLENYQTYYQTLVPAGFIWPTSGTTGDGQLYSYNLTWSGSDFVGTDAANLQARIAQILAMSPAPKVLILAINPSGVQDHANAFATDFASGPSSVLASAVATTGLSVTVYGLNWAPSPLTGAVAVDVYSGLGVGIPIPTSAYVAIGLPADPNSFANALIFDPYVLDAQLWASRCHTKSNLPATGAYSMQGTEFKFAPNTNTLLSKWLFYSIIRAGQTTITDNYTPYRINGIWSGNPAVPPGM